MSLDHSQERLVRVKKRLEEIKGRAEWHKKALKKRSNIYLIFTYFFLALNSTTNNNRISAYVKKNIKYGFWFSNFLDKFVFNNFNEYKFIF